MSNEKFIVLMCEPNLYRFTAKPYLRTVLIKHIWSLIAQI